MTMRTIRQVLTLNLNNCGPLFGIQSVAFLVVMKAGPIHLPELFSSHRICPIWGRGMWQSIPRGTLQPSSSYHIVIRTCSPPPVDQLMSYLVRKCLLVNVVTRVLLNNCSLVIFCR